MQKPSVTPSIPLLTLVAALTVSTSARAQCPSPLPPGSLDGCFGTGGIAPVDIVPNSDYVDAMAVQPDGRIVFADVATTPGSVSAASMVAGRLLSNGTLDPSFGSGGFTTVQFTSGADFEHVGAIALAPDLAGNPSDFDIVIAGYVPVSTSGKSTTYGMAVARLNSNGTPETLFGGGSGREVLSPVAKASSHVFAMTLDANGRIVLAGEINGAIALVRLTPNGSYDATFGQGGKVVTAVAGYAQSVLIDGAGRIVAGGGSYTLFRWNQNGVPDATFGSGGVVQTQLYYPNGTGTIAVDSANGVIVAARRDYPKTKGKNPTPPGSDIEVARFNPNGSRDTSFGSGGSALIDVQLNDDPCGLTLDANGNIVVAALAWGDLSGSALPERFVVVRLTPDGIPDPLFSGGVVVTDLAASHQAAPHALVITTAGIVVGGEIINVPAGGSRSVFVRYLQ